MDDFYTPTDADALRMENELLAFEVCFLKSRLAEAERLESYLEESKNRLEESERAVARFEDRLEEAERAEQDLVLLLRRLANSPLAPLLRFKQGFRTLEHRYLDTDA
ncbi:MAG: hypothetical protein H0T57_09220 [Rubrobacter sp.]|nr:hypothetical protein [Rubrobacter sp.]